MRVRYSFLWVTQNENVNMFKALRLLKRCILLIDLASRPGTSWTSAVLNWWLVLVGKEPPASTVSLAKSGAARTEGTEAMEEASLSRVALYCTCRQLCLVTMFYNCLKQDIELIYLFIFVSSQLIGLLNHWLRCFQSTREKMGSRGAARIVMAGMATEHMFTWVWVSEACVLCHYSTLPVYILLL